MTFILKVPRPSHTKSDYFEQEAWKKLATQVEKLQTTYPDAEVQLWRQDERKIAKNLH